MKKFNAAIVWFVVLLWATCAWAQMPIFRNQFTTNVPGAWVRGNADFGDGVVWFRANGPFTNRLGNAHFGERVWIVGTNVGPGGLKFFIGTNGFGTGTPWFVVTNGLVGVNTLPSGTYGLEVNGSSYGTILIAGNSVYTGPAGSFLWNSTPTPSISRDYAGVVITPAVGVTNILTINNTNSVPVVVVNSNGMVGIGTNWPQAKLDVYANSSYALTPYRFLFRVGCEYSPGTTNAMVIRTNGFVGINTNFPQAELHIFKNLQIDRGVIAQAGPAGDGQVVIGKNTTTNGSFSTIIGGNALQNSTNNTYATVIGRSAGNSTKDALDATIIGYAAAIYSTNLTDATVIGSNAGANATNSYSATLVGRNAGSLAPLLSSATLIGSYSGQRLSNGNNAIAIGYVAGQNVVDGQQATIIGAAAGRNSSNSANATIIGYGCLANATNSQYATVIGSGAGANLASASSFTAIGYTVGQVSTNAVNSVMIGYAAGNRAYNSPNSVLIGYGSGNAATNSTSATMVGCLSGNNSGVAPYATLIGGFSGQYAFNCSYLTSLGYGSGSTATNCPFGTFIGATTGINPGSTSSNGIAIGFGAKVTGDNQFLLGTDYNVGIATNNPQSRLHLFHTRDGGQFILQLASHLTNHVMNVDTNGNMYVRGDVDCMSVTDHSASPTNTADAWTIVNSHETKDGKLDHAKLSPLAIGTKIIGFDTGLLMTNVTEIPTTTNTVTDEISGEVRQEIVPGETNIVVSHVMSSRIEPDPDRRNLSVVISAQAMTIKDLDRKVKTLETTVVDLAARIAKLEAVAPKP